MTGAEESIELRVRDLRQLFNSLDPSPFNERDLDDDAEEYIVGWARELPSDTPLRIVVHMPEAEARKASEMGLDATLRHYFNYRADSVARDLKEFFRIGRRALAIGLTVFAICLLAGHLLTAYLFPGPLGTFLQESLVVVGWVANWRPAEIFLYDWWPLARRRNLYRRLGAASVEVRPYPTA